MNRPFSLAHLTMLGLSPPELIETAARAGYQFVSLRPIPVGAPNEPLYPLGTDRALREKTRAAMSATGVGLLDIEVARIIKEAKPRDYLPALEAAAELGGRHVLSSAWCDDRPYILDFFAGLCDLAKPLGLTVDLEFVTWSGVRTLDEAVEIVKEARRPNAGIVIDTLHFDRCHAELEKLSALPREWFHFAQISDAPATYSTERDELIRIGRAERLYLGEGGIDVASILGRLPQVPLSIEIPNTAKLASLGAEQYARLCIETARSFLAASAYRQAG
ncbi:MAG: TIM barrel protein [Peristeroidobacter soli]